MEEASPQVLAWAAGYLFSNAHTQQIEVQRVASYLRKVAEIHFKVKHFCARCGAAPVCPNDPDVPPCSRDFKQTAALLLVCARANESQAVNLERVARWCGLEAERRERLA